MRVQECIFRNMSILIGIAVVAILIAKFVPAVAHVVSTNTFQTIGFWAMLGALLAIVISPNIRFVLLVVFAATVANLMTLSQTSTAPAVLQALGLTLILFISFSHYGYNLETPFRGRPLFALLIGLVLVSLLNLFFKISILQTAMAVCGSLLFSAFIVYDSHRFARHCEGEHCCTKGTLALWLDFVNLFSDVLYLRN